MKKILLFVILFIFISCETTDIVIVNPIDDESKKLIEETELLILEYKVTLNKEFLKNAYNIIKNLEKKSHNNKYFEARVLGLKGEYEIASGNKNIKSIIDDIERKNKNEEKLYILKSYLTEDWTKKEEILKTGIEKANSNERIKLFLADIYFLQGKYRDSSSLYDEVFINISDGYKKFYTKRREIARIFIKTPPKNSLSGLIVEKDKITFEDLIKITDLETDIIKDFRGLKDLELKERLFNERFIFNKEINLQEFIKRRDIAYFLLRVISIIERDSSLLTKYSKDYEKLKSKQNPESKDLSPVPDVSTKDYFYTAVLVLVEREILELPDGKNFIPDNFMSGLEYFYALKKCR